MNIIILDDHPLILNALAAEIKSIIPEVTIHAFQTIENTKTFLESNSANYVICDLQIASGKSIVIPELCFRLNIPLMIYSSHTNKTLFQKLNEFELKVYVSKSSSPKELKNGILALLNEKKYFCSIVSETIKSDDNEVIKPLKISKTQMKIMSLLSEGNTQLEVSTKMKIAERTVINHLAILRNNNNCNSTAELIHRFKFWV
jgi:DNA-binding NarL/FixJ family response regulator